MSARGLETLHHGEERRRGKEGEAKMAAIRRHHHGFGSNKRPQAAKYSRPTHTRDASSPIPAQLNRKRRWLAKPTPLDEQTASQTSPHVPLEKFTRTMVIPSSPRRRRARARRMQVMVMVMVISALVRSHQSTSLVASATCVPRGYNTRAQPCSRGRGGRRRPRASATRRRPAVMQNSANDQLTDKHKHTSA